MSEFPTPTDDVVPGSVRRTATPGAARRLEPIARERPALPRDRSRRHADPVERLRDATYAVDDSATPGAPACCAAPPRVTTRDAPSRASRLDRPHAARQAHGLERPRCCPPARATSSAWPDLGRGRPSSGAATVPLAWVPGQEPGRARRLVDDFRALGAVTARLHERAQRWSGPAWFTRSPGDYDTSIGARGAGDDGRTASPGPARTPSSPGSTRPCAAGSSPRSVRARTGSAWSTPTCRLATSSSTSTAARPRRPGANSPPRRRSRRHRHRLRRLRLRLVPLRPRLHALSFIEDDPRVPGADRRLGGEGRP